VDAVNRLQHTTHPLETLLLGAVRPLLSYDHNTLISQHMDGENGNAATVDEFHGLNGQNSGNDVISVVSASRNSHQSFAAATHKDQATLPMENKVILLIDD
jgi:hypothetical protein